MNSLYPGNFSEKLVFSPALLFWQNELNHFKGIQSGFSHWLSQFMPVTLAQMANVSLLNRVDTKYVFTAKQLSEILISLIGNYWVLDINGTRLNHYQTLYFDTADFDLYLSHHAGRRQRYKVRSRQYMDTDLSFLEVKSKTGQNRTIKKRLQTSGFMTRFSSETKAFMKTCFPLNPRKLEPKLLNYFSRITLVNKQMPERLTLDLDLQFCHDGDTVSLPGVVVAEVKQNGRNLNSPFIQQMRALNIHPIGFSKYCVGVSLLYQSIKHNNFKPKLRLIKQLMQRVNDEPPNSEKDTNAAVGDLPFFIQHPPFDLFKGTNNAQ